jgi:beta-fructofuranosidase
MISKMLQDARVYEAREGALVSDGERPVFHFSPLIGWLNDPNGFSYYDGKYHLFYQYNPYSSLWDTMHWGHAVSDDLVTWEYLPAALAPDEEYDISGCFSGSALTLPDGRQLLMYTGCGSNKDDPLGKGRWIQKQCLAVSTVTEDGTTEYVKYPGNPVLTGEDLPDDADPYEFRDPYIWQVSDGTFRMLASNGRTGEISDEGVYITENGTQLTLFRSDDGFTWSYDKVLFEDDLRIGVMWECPNLFELDGRHVLIASPMDMIAEADEAEGSVRFPQGNNVCYIMGEYDEATETFVPDTGRRMSRIHEIAATEAEKKFAKTATTADGRTISTFFKYEPVDYGLDFYAPQVMKAPDGRTLMIGWMQDPKTSNMHKAEDFRIFGQMTLPRELSLRNGRLCQWPVRELEEYRGEPVTYKDVELTNEVISLDGVGGSALDLEVAIDNSCNGSDATYTEFAICFAADGEEGIWLVYFPDRFELKIDRNRCDGYEWNRGERIIGVSDYCGRLELRMLIDRQGSEIFINGGEQVISLTHYRPPEAQGIRFAAMGTASLNVTSYTISRG